MHPQARWLSLSFACWSLLNCASPAPAPKPVPEPAARATLAEAHQLVRDRIYSDLPTMNPAARFPLVELTTEDVWRRLGVQVFQVTEGVQQCETFVLRGSEVFRIGRGIGLYGVNSLGVAAFGKDAEPVLVYSYSWGSGIHRSRLAYAAFTAEGLTEHVAPETCFLMDDWTVQPGTDGQVDVVLRGQKIGELVVPAGQVTPTLKLTADLPKELQESIRS